MVIRGWYPGSRIKVLHSFPGMTAEWLLRSYSPVTVAETAQDFNLIPSCKHPKDVYSLLNIFYTMYEITSINNSCKFNIVIYFFYEQNH